MRSSEDGQAANSAEPPRSWLAIETLRLTSALPLSLGSTAYSGAECAGIVPKTVRPRSRNGLIRTESSSSFHITASASPAQNRPAQARALSESILPAWACLLNAEESSISLVANRYQAHSLNKKPTACWLEWRPRGVMAAVCWSSSGSAGACRSCRGIAPSMILARSTPSRAALGWCDAGPASGDSAINRHALPQLARRGSAWLLCWCHASLFANVLVVSRARQPCSLVQHLRSGEHRQRHRQGVPGLGVLLSTCRHGENRVIYGVASRLTTLDPPR